MTLTLDAKSYLADCIVNFFSSPCIRLYDTNGNLIKEIQATITKEATDDGYRVIIKATDYSLQEYVLASFDVYDSSSGKVFAIVQLETPFTKSSDEHIAIEYVITL